MCRRACSPAHVARLLPKCERAHCHVFSSRPQPLCALGAKCADWAFVPAWVLVLFAATSHIQHVRAFILHKWTESWWKTWLRAVLLFELDKSVHQRELEVNQRHYAPNHSLLLSHSVGRYVSPSWCLVWREVTLSKEAKWGFSMFMSQTQEEKTHLTCSSKQQSQDMSEQNSCIVRKCI